MVGPEYLLSYDNINTKWHFSESFDFLKECSFFDFDFNQGFCNVGGEAPGYDRS